MNCGINQASPLTVEDNFLLNKPESMTSEEWKARCELAALYRLLAYFRMTDLIDTHITLRLPDAPEVFLINRYGALFEHMRASDLVKVNYQGELIDEHYPEHRINAPGVVIHSAIHAAREDLHCVIHTHTAAGIAVSTQKRGLQPICQHALKFYKRLAYHDYAGLIDDAAESARLVSSLGQLNAMILRNHGIIVGGKSLAEAFQNIYMLERACQAQMQILSTGEELISPSPEICEHVAQQFEKDEELGIMQLTWEGALKIVEAQRKHYCA